MKIEDLIEHAKEVEEKSDLLCKSSIFCFISSGISLVIIYPFWDYPIL